MSNGSGAMTPAVTTYLDEHPLEFNISDARIGKRVLYFNSDPENIPRLTLELCNKSSRSLAFQQLTLNNGPAAAAAQHHLELHFQPNTLSSQTLSFLQNRKAQVLAPSVDWDLTLGTVSPGQVVSIYLAYIGSSQPLTLEPNQPVSLVLNGVSAAKGRGERPTQVEIRACSLIATDDTSATPITGSRLFNFLITDAAASRPLLMRLGLVADGVSKLTVPLNYIPEPTIPLQLTNAGTASATFKQDQSSLYLTSDFDDFPYKAQVSAVIKGVAGTVQEAVDLGASEGKNMVLGWMPSDGDVTLAPGDYLQIDLDGPSSSTASRQANFYIHYAGIPGYLDGQLMARVAFIYWGQIAQYEQENLPLLPNVQFTAGGGTLLIFFSGSGYSSPPPNRAGDREYNNLQMDIDFTRSNEKNVYKKVSATSTITSADQVLRTMKVEDIKHTPIRTLQMLSGVPAGKYNVSVLSGNIWTQFKPDDKVYLAIFEVPSP